ncbi:hypothetical protein F5148DRAFT_987334 [Russula earlei]|uniref:Uncharacterized protein n=1 Tax=Russula earlei TaxID=71964 RepID=A0ACC0TVI3_9AGAM|nr:hypothetical protein F5148DRAFT_987334 [Russula earlei]
MRYTVFLGAPSSSAHSDAGILYQWHTHESTDVSVSNNDSFHGYPSSELDATRRRLSALYENIISADDEDERDTQIVEEDLMNVGRQDQMAPLTWAEMTQSECESNSMNRHSMHASISRPTSSWQNNFETQEDIYIYTYSDTSSIARFPDFQFSLSTLSMLGSAEGKTCLLLAVLEVDGPDEVTVRRGPDTGHSISVLRLIVSDEASTIRKLTAWREIAETWGGAMQEAVGIRRGDVVYFENVLATPAKGGSGAPIPVITASTNLRSRAKICYRTMPRTSVPADMYLRPDLRLSASDAAVRRVAALVVWFERIAGLAT